MLCVCVSASMSVSVTVSVSVSVAHDPSAIVDSSEAPGCVFVFVFVCVPGPLGESGSTPVEPRSQVCVYLTNRGRLGLARAS